MKIHFRHNSGNELLSKALLMVFLLITTYSVNSQTTASVSTTSITNIIQTT